MDMYPARESGVDLLGGILRHLTTLSLLEILRKNHCQSQRYATGQGCTYLHNVVAGECKGDKITLLERLHPVGLCLALPLRLELREPLLLVELAVRLGVTVVPASLEFLGLLWSLRLCLLRLRCRRRRMRSGF